MHKLISLAISRLRKENFVLDIDIPIGYLVALLFKKCLWWMGGVLILHNKKAFVSPSSKIKCASKIKTSGYLSVAENCIIDGLSRNGVIFGNAVSIGRETSIVCTGSLKEIGKGLIVGDNVGLGEKCHYGCAGGVEIGDNTIVGIYVTMHSENHNFSDVMTPIRLQGVSHKGIKIGKNCWIGAKSTILDGTILGDGCVVAAGAVVTGAFPSNCIIGGVPARIIKKRI
jgi:hypothetical protein